MAYENLCMYCFRDNGGEVVCPHCGRDNSAGVPQIQLQPGSGIYNSRFLIGRALGQDANGIVYNALDTKKGTTLKIREYFPRNCAERLSSGAVAPSSGMEEAFTEGMRKLQSSVQGASDPSKRHFFFEENGTAYIAQRKAAASAGREEDDDDEGGRRNILVYILIAVAVVIAVAIAIIMWLNSLDANDVTKDEEPQPSASALAVWLPSLTPSPTPYATATFAPLVDPQLTWMDYSYSGDVNSDYDRMVEAAATRVPAANRDESFGTVSGKSSGEEVKALQTTLTTLGWLDPGHITGSYDAATVQAVKDFQQFVNENCNPAAKLTVDGIAGKKTQQWLYSTVVSLIKPTPTPVPLVTAAPRSDAVNEHSPASDIRMVQAKLASLGLLQGSADGMYGSGTRTAVKNFQKQVNLILGYQALEVTGEVDPLTMSYLNYYVEWWENRQSATATPGPSPTADDGTVRKGSPKQDVISLQQKLQKVSLLSGSQADGIYGSGTTNAVRAFQSWVNSVQGKQVLEVSGECDPLTMAYLDYCVDNGLTVTGGMAAETPAASDAATSAPSDTPTAAPSDTPTAAPSPTPTQAIITAAPTEEPTQAPIDEDEDVPEEGNVVVDESSEPESVSFVQEMLNTIGLLGENEISGVYGDSTKAAVKVFQEFVNAQRGEHTLEASGICDGLTIQYLEYCYDREMNVGELIEKATPEPTEEPKKVINENAPAEDIKTLQTMLAQVKLLSEGDADGNYGRKTRAAVEQFQQFVNEQSGGEVLEVTGEADEATVEYLRYCIGQNYDIGGFLNPTEVPTEEPTEEPTQEPTPEPTPEPTEEPTEEPQRVINENAPAEDIKTLQMMLAQVKLLSGSDADGDYGRKTRAAVEQFQQFVNEQSGGEVLKVTGEADEATVEYLRYCIEQNYDIGGFLNPTEVPTEEPAEEPTQEPTPIPKKVINESAPAEDIKTLQMMLAQVKLLSGSDADGNYGSGTRKAVEQFQQFVNEQSGGEVLEVTGEADEATVEYLEYCVGQNYDIGGFLNPTEVPTQEPTEEPPQVSKVTGFDAYVTGYGSEGVIELEPGTFTVQWGADDGVQSYSIVLSENGNVLRRMDGSFDTSLSMNTDGMKYDSSYVISIGALPVNGGEQDIIWKHLQLTLAAPPATSTPEPTGTPKPTAGKPVITLGSAAYTQDGIPYVSDSKLILSWNADGDVGSYSVMLVYQDDTQFPLGVTTDTSKTVSVSQLQPGRYKLYVGAIPYGCGEEDAVWSEMVFGIPAPEVYEEPEIIEEPEPEPQQREERRITRVSADSSEDDIKSVQMALYRYGFINTDNVSFGVLDNGTLEAVAAFQARVNEVYGLGLNVIDPYAENVHLDESTLDLLLYQNLEIN